MTTNTKTVFNEYGTPIHLAPGQVQSQAHDPVRHCDDERGKR
jgi:hypothetical protein